MGTQSQAKRKRRKGGVTGVTGKKAREAAWKGRKTIGVLSPGKRTLGEWYGFLRSKPDWAEDFTIWFVETYGERPNAVTHRKGARDYDLMLKTAAGAWAHLNRLLEENESEGASVQKGHDNQEDGGGTPGGITFAGAGSAPGERDLGYPRSTGPGGIEGTVQPYVETASGDSPPP